MDEILLFIMTKNIATITLDKKRLRMNLVSNNIKRRNL